MKRYPFVLLLCICTLGFVACSHKGNGEKVTYRFAPKIGQPMVYTTTSVTETSFFGQPITFTNKVKTKKIPISKENVFPHSTRSTVTHDLSYPLQNNGGPPSSIVGAESPTSYNNSRPRIVIGCSLSISILLFSSSKAQHHLASSSAGGHFLQCFVRFGKGENLSH